MHKVLSFYKEAAVLNDEVEQSLQELLTCVKQWRASSQIVHKIKNAAGPEGTCSLVVENAIEILRETVSKMRVHNLPFNLITTDIVENFFSIVRCGTHPTQAEYLQRREKAIVEQQKQCTAKFSYNSRCSYIIPKSVSNNLHLMHNTTDENILRQKDQPATTKTSELEVKKVWFREVTGPAPRAACIREKNKYPVNAIPLAIYTLPKNIMYECCFPKGSFLQIKPESKDTFWVAELLFDVIFIDSFLHGIRWYEAEAGMYYKACHIETKKIPILCVIGTVEMKEVQNSGNKSKRWQIERLESFNVSERMGKHNGELEELKKKSWRKMTKKQKKQKKQKKMKKMKKKVVKMTLI